MSTPIRIVRNSSAQGTAGQPADAARAQPLLADSLVDGAVVDRLRRPMQDLRISITDKCNFRCTYCMPREVFGPDYPFLPHQDLLTFEEITRVARIGTQLGLRKIRLTGGEPLLRKDIEVLVQMLAQLRTLEGEPIELALTTNGTLRSEEHTSELQSRGHLVCRLLLEKKKN